MSNEKEESFEDCLEYLDMCGQDISPIVKKLEEKDKRIAELEEILMGDRKVQFLIKKHNDAFEKFVSMKKQNAELREAWKAEEERMRNTLESLCRCSDGGVNSGVYCSPCKFKYSFNDLSKYSEKGEA